MFWLLLAMPALGLGATAETADALTAPSGEWSARMLIAALAVTPVAQLLGGGPTARWLLANRRAMGVAAFLYALLHLAAYLVDMGAWRYVRDELLAPGIWTGWAALLVMLPLALTSNDRAVRTLRRNWKRLQRLAYAAALLTLAHWIIVHNSTSEALAHMLPLALLQLCRLLPQRKDRP